MSGTILQLSEVSYRYNENSRSVKENSKITRIIKISCRIIFSNVDLSATMQSRICIVGENGAGE